jgi:chitin synthase
MCSGCWSTCSRCLFGTLFCLYMLFGTLTIFHGAKQGRCLYLTTHGEIDGFWCFCRKVEGERKGDGHGVGGDQYHRATIPLRRWEDWERSRLRKLRREDRRRKEFERLHPSGYGTSGDLLTAPDLRSQYDASDAQSVSSSEDDHWGSQIGGYNEHHAQYPPPPVGLLPHSDSHVGVTVNSTDLKAMLDAGFDDEPTPPSSVYAPPYQLPDGSTTQLVNIAVNGYAPMTRSTSPGGMPTSTNLLSPVSPTGQLSFHGRTVAGQRYGPLGPLDPSSRI